MSSTNPPFVGMVDDLPGAPRQLTPLEQSLVDFFLRTGPVDKEILAQLTDPSVREAYQKSRHEQQAQDWPNLGLYRNENQSAHQHARRPVVVFIGDSITELWKYNDPSFFSDGVVNRGVSGQTSPQVLARFYSDVVALKPYAVHILCGSNDIAGNTGPSTPQDFKNNILAMLDLAEQHGIHVLLGSITPANVFLHHPELRPGPRIKELNHWLHALATKRHALFLDYFSSLIDEQGSIRADCSNDNLHPNACGYEAMKAVVLPVMDQLADDVLNGTSH